MRPYQQKLATKTSKRRVALGIITAMVLFGGVITTLELTNTTHFFHDSIITAPVTPNRTGGQETKGERDLTPQETTKDKNDEPSSGTSDEFKEPSGSFVSNHRPNLSGTPAPNTVQSVCVTTPGATCTITFTKDGVTKSLPPQATDRGGASYWTWKLQDIGLTVGAWEIQAKATMNSKVKTTNDSMSLEVTQ